MKIPTEILTDGRLLLALDAPEHFHNPEKEGKYLENGMKPFEAFFSDIRQNLLCWTIETICGFKSVWYVTNDYIYRAKMNTGENKNLVIITRFSRHTWERLDTWVNASTAEAIGKNYLNNMPERRVPFVKKGQ